MSAPASPRSLSAGSLVAGRYEILDSLGAGGMASVFKAHDRALDVSVALKVLKASASRDPEMAARFRSEIKLAWRVRHRNVCGIHEYGEDGELLFISMELVEGKDLRQLLRDGGPLPWEDGLDVAIQIAEGLEAIHQAGVIHRDLKPANITRDARGLVRLMDFGIAKVWGEDSSGGATRGGHVVGSPQYMSPEQVRGASLDFRSDIYALGLVVYELFTGRGPFFADSAAAAMMRRLDEDPDWDAPAARQIPAAALPILRKALARDVARRHQSCHEILADLRAARAALARQATDPLGAPGESKTATGPAAPALPPVPIFSREAQARILVPPLAKAVKHSDRGVRLGAVEALGRLAGDALLVARVSRLAAAALQEALRDADELVRAAAVRSLARFPRAPVPAAARAGPGSSKVSDGEEQGAPRPAIPSPQPAPSAAPHSATCLLRMALPLVALVLAWSQLMPRSAPEAPSTGSGSATVAPAPALPSADPPRSDIQPSADPTASAPPTMSAPRSEVASLPAIGVGTRPRRAPAPSAVPSLPGPLPEPQPEPSPPPSTEPSPGPAPALVSTLPAPSLVADTPAPPVLAAPEPNLAPVCLSCPIPEAARVLRARLGLARAVQLRLHLTEQGEVRKVEYLAGPVALREAITKAAQRWRYRPAQRGPVPVAAVLTVDLEL